MTYRFTRNLLAIVCVIGAIVIALMMLPDAAAGPCVVVEGSTNLPDIPEASGLAVSRRNPGILWSHNDSGNATVLFALDAAGALRGRRARPDWPRAIGRTSAAHCPVGDCLYIADIGDNGFGAQTHPDLSRAGTAPGDAETATPEVFSAGVCGRRPHAEALFVVGEDLFIVTRDRTAGLYRAAQPPSR